MRDNLALIIIGAYAITFFIGGYVWKTIRNERNRRDANQLMDSFEMHSNNADCDYDEQKPKRRPVAAATR